MLLLLHSLLFPSTVLAGNEEALPFSVYRVTLEREREGFELKIDIDSLLPGGCICLSDKA
jgi:hypothetical protein